MSRQLKNGKCSCWASVDKELLPHNTRLATSFTFDGKIYLNIATEKIEKGKKPKLIVASHCPFCGAKLK